jgi:hypothetical protein
LIGAGLEGIMPQCPCCGDYLPGARDRYRARCPHCRGPLSEQPEDYVDEPRPPAAGTGTCPSHPLNAAVGTCQRCGNYLCRVCRTRWRDQAYCTACVERALEAGAAAPQEARAHLRNGMLGVGLGVGAWVLCLAGVVVFAIGASDFPDPAKLPLVLLGMGIMALSPFLSVFGVGHGASAIRARGDHMIVATAGLILSALHVGVMIGLCVLLVWQAWQD